MSIFILAILCAHVHTHTHTHIHVTVLPTFHIYLYRVAQKGEHDMSCNMTHVCSTFAPPCICCCGNSFLKEQLLNVNSLNIYPSDVYELFLITLIIRSSGKSMYQMWTIWIGTF